MNTKLVESLVQIIQSLAPEEQALLEERLKATTQKNRQQSYQELIELREKIFARRGGKPFDPPLSEYIQQCRDERTAQHDELVRELFGEQPQP